VVPELAAGSFNVAYPVFSVLLYGVELFGFLTACVNAFMTWRLSVRRRRSLLKASIAPRAIS
jgi:hypothetical protein